MSLPVRALFVAMCVSAGQQESSVVSPRHPTEEKSGMTKELQNRAEESLKRNIADHVEPGISIEEVNVGGGNAKKPEQKDKTVMMDEGRFKRQAYKNESYTRIWRDLEVPYQFDRNLSKRAKTAFRKAARLWTNFTCIDITEQENGHGDEEEDEEDTNIKERENGYDEEEDEKEEDLDYYYHENDDLDSDYDDEEGIYDENTYNEYYAKYILVHGGNGCRSYVGNVRLPLYQNITLGQKCETIGTAAHELAHALGFIHTQERHDRDEYILVDKSNIEKVYHNQFEAKSNESNNNYGLPYDYGSVMHYGITAGSENRTEPTMVPNDGLYNQTLGSPFISFYDILMMNTHYNCTGRCKNHTSSQCQNGGFPHPRICVECICPSGYGGRLCDERPAICGEEVNATSNWTLLVTANSSVMTHGSQDGYKKCVYWINAPNGSYVEVKLTKLPENVAKEGCIYGGVEIKARKDQGLTGYRFCSKENVNLTLISNTSTLPVLTYMRRRRNDTAIELEYRIAEKTRTN